MQWFGEPWPRADLRAPVCEDDALRVEGPGPGELCVLCGLDFEPDARGVLMPHLTGETYFEMRYCHLGCLFDNVGGEGISFNE